MSLDLYQNEAIARLSGLAPVQVPQASAFDSFGKGTGMYAMRALAGTARAIDLAGAVGPIIQDAITGGTVAQDRYFKEHDDFFNSAVDYWTPRANEVGVAGEVVGNLLGTLGTVMINPSLAVGATQLGVAEDLARQGVDAGKAVGAGTIQGAGLGLGVWMPILGSNGWQRIVVGGAGFNALQGAATRGATGAILDGTPAADQFKALDGTALTLDVLLGAAFGGLAHVSPAQRAQGKAAWDEMRGWAEKLNPADKDAIATLRVAQHANVDSAPGKLADLPAIDSHVTRVRAAVDQLLRGEPVELSNLPLPRATPDQARVADAVNRIASMRASSDVLVTSLDLPASLNESPVYFHGTARAFDEFDDAAPRSQKGFPDRRGHYFTKYWEDASAYAGKDGRVIEARLTLRNPKVVDQAPSYLTKKMIEELEAAGHDGLIFNDGEEVVAFRSNQIHQLKQPAAPARAGNRTEAQPGKDASPPPPPGTSDPAGASAKPDPLADEAARLVAERPDEQITIGRNPDGTPIVTTTAKYLADTLADVELAKQHAALFEVAAGCYLRNA